MITGTRVAGRNEVAVNEIRPIVAGMRNRDKKNYAYRRREGVRRHRAQEIICAVVGAGGMSIGCG